MASASEFSTDPDANVSIGGKNVAEHCSPDALNDVERYLAAAMRSLYDQVQTLTGAMPVTGGTFTGDISRQGQGGYSHNADPALTDGKVYFLAEGSAMPAAAPGRVVWFFS